MSLKRPLPNRLIHTLTDGAIINYPFKVVNKNYSQGENNF